MFREQEGYPVANLCSLLALPRSSYYYQPVKRDENELREAVEEVASEFVTYGSRRVTQELRRPPHEMIVIR